MEDSSKSLTPQESLELIGRYILNYRNNLRHNSYFFLLWGWLVIIASVTHFIAIEYMLHMGKLSYQGMVAFVNWGGFTLAGMIFSSKYSRRLSAREKSHSPIEKYISTLWRTMAFAIILEVFLVFRAHYYFPIPFILTLVGLATIVTGVTIKFRPLVIGGLSFFAFAVVSSFFNNEYQLLVNAAALICGYLIPGYLLKATKND